MPLVAPDRDPAADEPLLARRPTATEAAADAVRGLILSFDLPVGTPLRQDDLARRLGVSRTPLREALNRLATEGLVRLDAHHGAVVASPSTDELVEIYEVRELLEVHAARLAARRAEPADVVELEKLLERAPKRPDAASAARANAEFHDRLYAVARHRVLAETIRVLRNRSEAFVRLLFASPARAAEAMREHHEMVDALGARDADRLALLIHEHLEGTVRDVIPLISDGAEPHGHPRHVEVTP